MREPYVRWYERTEINRITFSNDGFIPSYAILKEWYELTGNYEWLNDAIFLYS